MTPETVFSSTDAYHANILSAKCEFTEELVRPLHLYYGRNDVRIIFLHCDMVKFIWRISPSLYLAKSRFDREA